MSKETEFDLKNTLKKMADEEEEQKELEFWEPSVGDNIIMKVESKIDEFGKFGKPVFIGLRLDASGYPLNDEINSCINVNVSLEKFYKKVEEGDIIVILFKELKDTGKGQPFKLFKGRVIDIPTE